MSTDKGETLTDSMLAALPAHLRPVREGKYLRAGCPFHGSDQQRSLSINTETGRFQCFGCSVWGYTEQAREQWAQQHQASASKPYRPPAAWAKDSGTERLRADGNEPQALDDELMQKLQSWQAALPEAADYLAGRRIPLELVRQMGGGVGMMGKARRLILPHTDPAGRIVSLYGRRIDGGSTHKHHHLQGRPKGFLNAQAVAGPDLWVTEGPFDALALVAAGIPNAAAVFGVDGIRWGWLGNVRRLVLALDADGPGQAAVAEHAKQAAMRGLQVYKLTHDELGGAKDIAEAWAAGTLNLAALPGAAAPATQPPSPSAAELARWAGLIDALPDSPPAGYQAEQWLDYKQAARRFVREHGELALALKWTELELFGLPDSHRPYQGGAIWQVAQYELRELTAESLRAVTDKGAQMTARRELLQPDHLPWQS